MNGWRITWRSGATVLVNRGKEDWTVAGKVLPQYGCIATNGVLSTSIERIGGVAMYSVDALVRRANALQRTPDAWTGDVRINAKLAATLGLGNGDAAMLQQAGGARGQFRVTRGGKDQ